MPTIYEIHLPIPRRPNLPISSPQESPRDVLRQNNSTQSHSWFSPAACDFLKTNKVLVAGLSATFGSMIFGACLPVESPLLIWSVGLILATSTSTLACLVCHGFRTEMSDTSADYSYYVMPKNEPEAEIEP